MLAMPDSDGFAKADSTAEGSFPTPGEPIRLLDSNGAPEDVTDGLGAGDEFVTSVWTREGRGGGSVAEFGAEIRLCERCHGWKLFGGRGVGSVGERWGGDPSLCGSVMEVGDVSMF